VGWYEQKVFNPMILDPAMDSAEIHAERARALASASGEILEIGVGTGLNLPRYPRGVARVTSLGPEPALHPRAARRAVEGGVEVEHREGDARAMPFDAGRFDTVVCTFVLCTIPEPDRAVSELRRVLKPGGRLLFLEHVAATRGARRVFQRALVAPLRLALCGCEVTRDTEGTLVRGGFALGEIERYDVPAMMWLFRGVIRGVGRAA
jgi:ubiquinone/menaquinone biosynthesis C-methylase UbiE